MKLGAYINYNDNGGAYGASVRKTLDTRKREQKFTVTGDVESILGRKLTPDEAQKVRTAARGGLVNPYDIISEFKLSR